jgi:two-component system OmpR family sensor kinase
MLTNLITNAIKFTPPGGQVALEGTADDDSVTFRVSDTGMGISVEDQPQIFDRFYRSATVHDAVIGGAGLGLSLVHGLVAAHAGSIGVESALGQGTTMTVRLPRTVAAPVPTEERMLAL